MMSDEAERRVEVVQAITQLQAGVQHCVEKIDANTELTNKILTTLHGNGGGLVVRTSVLETIVEGLQSTAIWTRRTVLGAFIIGVIGLAYWIIRGSLT